MFSNRGRVNSAPCLRIDFEVFELVFFISPPENHCPEVNGKAFLTPARAYQQQANCFHRLIAEIRGKNIYFFNFILFFTRCTGAGETCFFLTSTKSSLEQSCSKDTWPVMILKGSNTQISLSSMHTKLSAPIEIYYSVKCVSEDRIFFQRFPVKNYETI